MEGGRGNTSTWIKPTQYTQTVNGVEVAMYIDEFGRETFSPDGFRNLPEWSPIFLEKGELTFDTSGNLVSPKQGSQLDTVFLPDGKGALTININYSKSTQFSSPYAVLSQSQDGAPEGDLVGLAIADDGLVSASFSNGAQKSLGKVVLVNFSNPSGLRQIGDSSYYASSQSGKAKVGERKLGAAAKACRMDAFDVAVTREQDLGHGPSLASVAHPPQAGTYCVRAATCVQTCRLTRARLNPDINPQGNTK